MDRKFVRELKKLGITEEMFDQLATLEHGQWAHWMRYMLDNLTTENIERWR